jgi:hypothetical protein
MPSTQVNLEKLRLLGAAIAEVAIHRVGDGLDVVHQDPLELGEVLSALVHARVGVTQIGLALQHEDALRLVLDDLEGSLLGGLGHGSSGG